MQGLKRPIDVEVDASDTQRRSLIPQLRRPLVWVVSLHGGSGATTVAGLLGEHAAEAGRCWPTPAGEEAASPVLLVARTHARGQDEAEAAARTWASGYLGDLPLLGLVLVEDAPKLTSSQARACSRLGALVPYTWRLPWQPEWREEIAPDPAIAPFRVRHIAADIRSRALMARKVPSTT